jgi:hypothetical protein
MGAIYRNCCSWASTCGKHLAEENMPDDDPKKVLFLKE